MVKAIVGANWGDEGKGKITDMLAQDSDIIIRFQGGANAGHTIINDYGKFALHTLPSGIFYGHTTSIIGNGVALNIPILFIIVWQLNVSSCLFFGWMFGRELSKVLFQIMGDPLQGIVEIHTLFLCHAVSAVSQCRVDPGTDFFDYSAAFLGQII